MKKLLTLFTSILILASCSRTTTSYSDYSHSIQPGIAMNATPATHNATASTEPITAASDKSSPMDNISLPLCDPQLMSSTLNQIAENQKSKPIAKLITKAAMKMAAHPMVSSHPGLTQKLENVVMKKIAKYNTSQDGDVDSGGDLFALLSLIFGIAALVSYYGAFLFGLLAIIFGVIALGNTSRPGMATIGIILGVIGILLWGFIIVIVV